MKKSKQSENRDAILNLSKNKIRVKTTSLGDVELKYVSYGDTRDFAKLLTRKLSDRDFVIETLHHQFIKPKINLQDLKKLSDKELINIAKVFVKNEDYTFKYWCDSRDYFADFRNAVATQEEKHLKELEKTFEPMIRSAQETLKAFHKNYGLVIQQALDASSYIKDSLQEVSRVAEQFRETRLELTKFLEPICRQCQSTARMISEFLKPHIDFWRKWTEQNKSALESIGRFWSDFQKRYKIAEKEAVQILQKYKWFISPSMPTDFIFDVVQAGKKKGRRDKAINKIFMNHYSNNNWQNLEAMVYDWKNKPLPKKRIKILLDCVQTVKIGSSNKINVANVVLPTLITQIDGVLTDYLDNKGIGWDCAYDDFLQKGKVKKKGRKSQFQKNWTKTLSTKLDDLANDIFLNILFQRSQKGKPLKTPFNFNRHKIIHGENFKYGRKDYMIRAFLILDFLAHLK